LNLALTVQIVAGQIMRLEETRAIRVFTDVVSGKSREPPNGSSFSAMP